MINKEAQLDHLRKLLKWKESKAFYAKKLNISIGELNDLLWELKKPKEMDVNSPEGRLALNKIDTDKFQVKTGWLKDKGMSIMFSKTEAKEAKMQSFAEFLKTFQPKENVIVRANNYNIVNSCLVLNIQDAHYNKHDINGKNNIHARFKRINEVVHTMLRKAVSTTNLRKIVYVLGSDIFNSEWTNMTTKGTPQNNIMSYQEGFKAICQHEIDTIELLTTYADEVEVIYCPGNHDEFAGWHLLSWLQMYFRKQGGLTFDIDPKYTKYIRFSNTAMCFNHGDGAKPEVVARNFPVEYKEEWSKCDHFIIFGGDKHTELSRDLGGIKFYRIPALSTAQSNWDAKNGYIAKAEMTAFLIEQNDGLTDIMKRII